MTEPLGLSIGMTHLVAARVGRAPVMRRSILTLFDDRAPEVGVPTGSGLVLSGFVDRVGDPVPLVAADGSAHRGETVLAEALEAMARTVDGGSPVAIAVPAHWGPGTVGALRGALRNKPSLAPDGVPAALIPDSTAALAALQAAPGLPDRGVVLLVDLGGSGSSITLADAAANLDAIGQTVRYPELSGDGMDQALLNHVLAGIADANKADPAGTEAVGALSRLRDECRKAKERLSAETATVVQADLPGFRSDLRVTRPEFEQVIAEPLGGLLNAIDDTLQRNQIQIADVTAVATVGGGAAIPLVTQRLSEHLRAPVVTTPESQLNVAAGAALVANRSLEADAPTGLAAAADIPTAMGPAAWAAGAAGLAAGESAQDGAASATFRALAWSQDDESAGDPLPYTGDDYATAAAYGDPGATGARPPVAFGPGDDGYDAYGGDQDEPPPLPWYKRPPVLFGAAAAAALLAMGGLAVTLTNSTGEPAPVTETATPDPGEPAAPVLPDPVTTVTVGPDGQATTTVSQPPPVTPSPTTTTAATTTTTEPTTTTTTTTTATTTTTTRTTTTRPTTTQPTTTTPPPTTTAPPPTTQDPPDPPDPITTTVIAPDDGA
ncbi:Chaperone protein DnaK [Mycolicibacterium vanbaalenii]|uniref:Chaperone protein DnaK n=1 Tax=Mycolicibacterium vanbaalenii TaxID=110539 RepID=A0A5S9PUA3_MYCVN|nr:Hsp70 family protein [Mycolicibacterium vanbaalenii]CAA0108041.1 Chaperone protein DnaK [Mycolicibacterium vanbaalenii]